MAHLAGMLLGAFIMLYCFYGWWYGEEGPFKWSDLTLPLHWLWYDTYFHSKASLRRIVRNLKRNLAIAASGMWIGWGIADGLLLVIGK